MKNQYYLSIFVLLFLTNFLNGQALNYVSTLDSKETDIADQIEIDADNNIFYAGYFSNTLDLNPGAGVNEVMALGASDIFVTKISESGDYLWSFTLKSFTSDVALMEMVVDADNNLILTGKFTNETDFDPDAGESLLSVEDGENFIAKYDNDGNFLWVIQIGSDDNNADFTITSMVADAMGDLIFGGFHYRFAGLTDVEGTTTNINGSNFSDDFYVAKISGEGVFQWRYFVGSEFDEKIQALDVDSEGNVYATGEFKGELDFDWHNFFTDIYEPDGPSDGFVMKLNAAGEYLWTKVYTSPFVVSGYHLVVDSADDVIISGYSANGGLDIDLGTAETTISNRVFVTKIDGEAALQWYMGYTNIDYSRLGIGDMHLDSDDNLFLTSSFIGNLNVISSDLNTNTLLSSENSLAIILTKVSPDGMATAHQLGSTYTDEGRDIHVDNDGNVVILGRFSETIDFDLGSNYNYVSSHIEENRNIFVTSFNGNCLDFLATVKEVKSVICDENGEATIEASGGAYPFDYQWNTTPITIDSIAVFENAGNYEVTVSDAVGCQRIVGVVVDGTDENSQIDHDFTGNVVANSFRTGFDSYVWLDVFNRNCVAADGLVKLVPHSLLNFENADPAPDFISNDTLIWEVTNLRFDTSHFKTQIQFNVSTDAMIGDTVNLQLIVTPTEDDVNPADNIKTYYYPIINAYDPNDKNVHPARCEENFITNEEALTYTVRFQNTGNAEAINVHILDTLDANLDLTTLRVVANNHSLITEILDGQIIDFRFDNILLPDSLSNEAESHGFVVFEINALPNLPFGTALENSAAIYFDFNPPVITNTIANTIIENLPNCFPVSTADVSLNNLAVTVFPNPVINTVSVDLGKSYAEVSATLLDVYGREFFVQSAEYQQNLSMDMQDLPAGVYYLKIKTTNKLALISIIKQ